MKEIIEKINKLREVTFEPYGLELVIDGVPLDEKIDAVIELLDEYREELFAELRGLLKEHAQFPNIWNTDKHLIDWLKEKGEYESIAPA